MEKEEEPVTFLDRSSRATRGKRMNKLLDEENEDDELFWNQDALKEEEHDGEYEEEPEVADEFDSDFNEDEPEADEAAENEIDERARPRKRLIYPGKLPVKKKKKKELSKIEKDMMDEKPSELSTPSEVTPPDDVEEERVVRKSTRTSVIVRQAERDAVRAALQATMKPIIRKKQGEEKKMTQEEMLLEAAQTEVMNLRNLERVLAREEEVKKRAIMHKEEYKGPQLRYYSKNGCSYIELSKGLTFDSEISAKAVPYPQKAVCAVTGLPAKYQDPLTGLPYATKEAFQVIRERYSRENSGGRKAMDMGNLSDEICGQGFLARRKRSVGTNQYRPTRTECPSRFRPVLTVDSDLSE